MSLALVLNEDPLGPGPRPRASALRPRLDVVGRLAVVINPQHWIAPDRCARRVSAVGDVRFQQGRHGRATALDYRAHLRELMKRQRIVGVGQLAPQVLVERD